ncbi:ATPase, partial [Candidatus Shapirobacteria bacterium CG03_land_8_20_14_0_80_35_14]
SAGTVFIDEVQRKENAGVFLKGIYDMDLGYKFVVTGSGSFELNEKIVESMAGRKRLFELNSLSFKEFVDYKTDYKYVENYDLLQKFEEDKLSLMLQEYLIFGGYPRVILSSDEAEKRLLATEIFNSYLDKDIRGWLGVDKIQEFTEMCRVLAAESGQLLDMTKLGKQTALSYKTIKNYLWYLEKTYIIRTVRPFGKNKVNELVRSPMVYFNDLGMRNFLLGQLYQRNFKINLVDTSFLFQNLIFLMLIDLTEINLLPYDICYWRTKSGAEVDFVWGNIVKPIPVEVKFSKQKNVTRSLMSFMNKYMPEKAFLVNLEVEKKYRGVDFVPYWRLMEKNFLG